jgi:uncharacterized protein (TIGR02284 family)
MAINNEKTASVLNELIEICKDGQQGFASAAEAVENPELRTLFTQYSAQRASFAQELQREVRSQGEKAETTGHVAGTLHRGWINLKAAITGKNEHAIVAECERGEDAAKEAYQKALEGNQLPGTVLPIVQRQSREIQAAHDKVKAIRDSEPYVVRR